MGDTEKLSRGSSIYLKKPTVSKKDRVYNNIGNILNVFCSYLAKRDILHLLPNFIFLKKLQISHIQIYNIFLG